MNICTSIAAASMESRPWPCRGPRAIWSADALLSLHTPVVSFLKTSVRVLKQTLLPYIRSSHLSAGTGGGGGSRALSWHMLPGEAGPCPRGLLPLTERAGAVKGAMALWAFQTRPAPHCDSSQRGRRAPLRQASSCFLSTVLRLLLPPPFSQGWRWLAGRSACATRR